MAESERPVGLRQAPDKRRFDLAFGGARRDEEPSRAKEGVFSVRSAKHRWDPRRQRPELWRLYNARTAPGEQSAAAVIERLHAMNVFNGR